MDAKEDPVPLTGMAARVVYESSKKILHDAEVARTMPDDIGGALARARSKPRWCSDVRWRMELARRKRRGAF